MDKTSLQVKYLVRKGCFFTASIYNRQLNLSFQANNIHVLFQLKQRKQNNTYYILFKYLAQIDFVLNCNSLFWVYCNHAFNHFLDICWNEDWDTEMSPLHLKTRNNMAEAMAHLFH